MLASSKVAAARRFSSQQPPNRQFNSMMSRPRLHNGMGSRPRVIDNPLASHHRSKQQQDYQRRPLEDDEPIYHSLDDDEAAAATAIVTAGHRPHGHMNAAEDEDVTVYINADLEVVYPSLPHTSTKDPASDDEEAELNGLLADCYENEELHGYVPSPAPGSYPRGHLSYTAAANTSLQRQQPRQPPPQSRHFQETRERGYLV